MIKKEIQVLNESGLHARPSALIVYQTEKFRSKVMLKRGDVEAKCDSLVDLLSLGAVKGTTLELIVDGEDEEEAIKAIEALFLNKFDE
jgi:phosphotransferase system HPr (HPr) family protein